MFNDTKPTHTPICCHDLGTDSGFAYRDSFGVVTSGMITFANSAKHPGYRFARWRKWLADLYEEIKPKVVCYENVINRPKESGVEVAHCYGAFRGILLEVCALKGIEVMPVGIQQIKMCVTGKGNSQKELVMACVQRDFPMQKVTDHNQADALGLLKVSELIRAGRWVMPTKESKKKSFKGNRDAWKKKLQDTQPKLF